MALEIITTPDDQKDAIRISVSGEVDVSCASDLREDLDAALEGSAKLIIVDVQEMSYIDSTGIGVLVGFVHRAKEEDVEVVIEKPQRNVQRVFSLLGIDDKLGIKTSDDAKDERD